MALHHLLKMPSFLLEQNSSSQLDRVLNPVFQLEYGVKDPIFLKLIVISQQVTLLANLKFPTSILEIQIVVYF